MKKIDSKYRKMMYEKDSNVIKKRQRLTKTHSTLKDNWNTSDKYKVKPILKIPFIISLVFFVITVSVVLLGHFRDFDKLISPKKVIIEIDAPSFVLSGATSNVNVKIKNYNPVPITLADIVVSHPYGTIIPEIGDSVLNVTRDGIRGGIESNEIYNYNYRPVFYGKKGEEKEIKIKLEYHIKGSKSLFVVENSAVTKISNSLLSLEINANKNTTSGKTLPFELEIFSNTDKEIKNIRVKPRFPSSFIFKDSIPSLQQEGIPTWYIPILLPRESERINFYGILSGSEKVESSFSFDVYLEIGSGEGSEEILVYNDNHFLTIENAFLTTELKVNGKSGDVFIVEPGKPVSVMFSVINENDFLIEDLVVEIIFEGNALDESKVSPGKGFYDGDRRKIIYNKIQVDNIKLLKVGEKERFSFSINTLPSENESPISITEKQIKIHADIYGNLSTDDGFRLAQAQNLNTTIIKAKTDIITSAKTLHSTSFLQNTGPIPPKKGETTQYALSFFIRNSGNNLKNTVLKIPLNHGIMSTGEYFPTHQDVTYDENTHTVLWNIENLSNEGPQSKRNIEIQVETTPSIVDVGRNIDLTKKITLDFFDTFTEVEESINIDTRTTYIRDEINNHSSGRVVE